MSAVTNNDLANQLGDIREKVGAIVSDQKHASQGRAVLHEKLDRLTDSLQVIAVALAETGRDAAQATATAAQTRDRLDAIDRTLSPAVASLTEDVEQLKKTHADELVPLVSTVKQVRNVAGVFAGIAALGVASVGGTLAFANDFARNAVLGWLGLS